MANLNNNSVHINNESNFSSLENMQVKIRSGSSIVKVKPLFSYNSKCLIVASGPNVKIFNIQSCECLNTLRYHKTNVVSLQESKANCLQFLSCSEDGTVVKWEFGGTFLKTWDLKSSVVNFYAPTSSSVWFFTKKVPNSNVCKLFSTSNRDSYLHKVLPNHNAISFGCKAKFVAGVYENALNIYNFETEKFVMHTCGAFQLECVICHPTDFSVATGDNKGRIIFWSNIFNSKQVIRSLFHWHTLPVADLAFSLEGSYLYSGGGEACLVKWNLFKEERFILPRLGAPIEWVKEAPDGTCIVTSLNDNSLHIIDPQKNVTGLIQGLTRGHFRGHPKQGVLSTGLLYDPQTKSIVLNGKPGHLQFYGLFDDKHLFNLDISAKNFISNERDSKRYNVDVSKAAIDDRGQWLATVEYWCDGEVSPMIWLKFWEYNADKLKFVMNTNIYLPHNKEVNCITFRPYDSSDSFPLAVTTSEDAQLKTWSLFDDDRFEGKQSWNCALQDCYRENVPGGDAAYSEDGTVLAVAFGSVVTLWTENNKHLEASLSQEKNNNTIKQLRFGKQSCNQFLVCHDGLKIYIWDLRSLRLNSIVNVAVQTIASDVSSDVMVAFVKDNKEDYHNLYLFKPSNPRPLFFLKNVSKHPVLSALFVPKTLKSKNSEESNSLDNSQVFFFNEDQCLLTLTDECDDDLDSNLEKIKMNVNLPMTPFGFLQAEEKSSSVKQVKPQQLAPEHVDSSKDSLDYPNPTYVDHFSMCSKVLKSLLSPRLVDSDLIKDTDNDAEENGMFNKNVKESKEETKIKIEVENLMDTTIVEESESLTNLVADFSFLLKHMDLPLR